MRHTMQVDWTPPGMERSALCKAVPWTFNGDLDRPVFGPSLLVRSELGEARTPYVCHSFIGCNGAQPGQITFLGDCTHALAGQTIDLPDVEPDAAERETPQT